MGRGGLFLLANYGRLVHLHGERQSKFSPCKDTQGSAAYLLLPSAAIWSTFMASGNFHLPHEDV